MTLDSLITSLLTLNLVPGAFITEYLVFPPPGLNFVTGVSITEYLVFVFPMLSVLTAVLSFPKSFFPSLIGVLKLNSAMPLPLFKLFGDKVLAADFLKNGVGTSVIRVCCSFLYGLV